MYELCLGDESLTSVIDRIAARACGVAPGLEPDACRRLLVLIFRVRVRRTAACGSHPDCRPTTSVWRGGDVPRGATAQWLDLDPLALPAMFGAAAADLVDRDDDDRAELEVRLAVAFRSVMKTLLFCNPRCGHAEICNAEAVFDQIDGDPDPPGRA